VVTLVQYNLKSKIYKEFSCVVQCVVTNQELIRGQLVARRVFRLKLFNRRKYMRTTVVVRHIFYISGWRMSCPIKIEIWIGYFWETPPKYLGALDMVMSRVRVRYSVDPKRVSAYPGTVFLCVGKSGPCTGPSNLMASVDGG